MVELEAFHDLYKPELEEHIKYLFEVVAWSIDQKNIQEQTISQLTKEKSKMEQALTEVQDTTNTNIHDLCEQLSYQKVNNDELQRNKEKAQSNLHNQVDSLKKELKQTKKKVKVAEKKVEVVTSEWDLSRTQVLQVTSERDSAIKNLEFVQEQIHDISDFGHLVIGLPKDLDPIISGWIKGNADKVAHRRKEWEEERLGDEAPKKEANKGEEP